jgi:hypothetical protein
LRDLNAFPRTLWTQPQIIENLAMLVAEYVAATIAGKSAAQRAKLDAADSARSSFEHHIGSIFIPFNLQGVIPRSADGTLGTGSAQHQIT